MTVGAAETKLFSCRVEFRQNSKITCRVMERIIVSGQPDREQHSKQKIQHVNRVSSVLTQQRIVGACVYEGRDTHICAAVD